MALIIRERKIKMRKFAIASFSLLAILLLSVIPFMDSFGIKSAEALNLSMQWGYFVGTGNSTFDYWEKYYEIAVCEAIYDQFDSDPYEGSEPIDAYWNYTSSGWVGQCLDWQRDPEYDIDLVTNWWVGDFHASEPPTPLPWGHIWFYGIGGDDISDDFVHDHATDYSSASSQQVFNFMWTCSNGGLWWNDNYGNYDNVSGIFYPLPTASPVPTNTNDEYGYWVGIPPYMTFYGMPYAWTGHLDMDLDGYNSYEGDYCYIGFEGASPFMINTLPEGDDPTYYFPINFYDYALSYITMSYETIHDSLNYASWNTYGCAFQNSPLYTGYWRHTTTPVTGYWFCHMRVFGNGDMYLPGWF
jgi:hypothetical protein